MNLFPAFMGRAASGHSNVVKVNIGSDLDLTAGTADLDALSGDADIETVLMLDDDLDTGVVLIELGE